MIENVVTRKLAAVVFADLVAYSQLMGENEAQTHRRFLSCVEDLVKPLVQAYRGRVVKTTGDGFMAEFDSAISAVECAVKVQESMQSHNDDLDDAHRLRFRIGINAGDVIFESDDLYGDEVNIAARLDIPGQGVSLLLHVDGRRSAHLRLLRW